MSLEQATLPGFSSIEVAKLEHPFITTAHCRACRSIGHERRARLASPERQRAAKALRRMRLERGLSQVLTADRAGLARTTVSLLENCRTTCHPSTVVALAGFFGVDTSTFAALASE